MILAYPALILIEGCIQHPMDGILNTPMCAGILELARRYTRPQMEDACQALLAAHLLSYREVKTELEHRTATASQTALPAHENVRGSSYYQ